MEIKDDKLIKKDLCKNINCWNCGARMIYYPEQNLFKCVLCGNSVEP